MKVRIGLCPNDGRGAAICSLLVEPSWNELVKHVSNKMKLSKKKCEKIRLYLLAPGKETRVLLELTEENVVEKLQNGALVVVAPAGAECLAKGGAGASLTAPAEGELRLPALPHHAEPSAPPEGEPDSSHEQGYHDAEENGPAEEEASPSEGLTRSVSTTVAGMVPGATRYQAREVHRMGFCGGFAPDLISFDQCVRKFNVHIQIQAGD